MPQKTENNRFLFVNKKMVGNLREKVYDKKLCQVRTLESPSYAFISSCMTFNWSQWL